MSRPEEARPPGTVSVREKLRRLGAARPAAGDRAAPTIVRPDDRAEDGVEVVRARFGFSHRHGRAAVGDCARALARCADGATVWLDTETTGLAGGTGTHVFLVGIGAFEDDGFTIEQYLLRRLSAEVRFLGLIHGRLARARHLVTFNGRRFDCPLLEARYVLARVTPVNVEAHTDLIFAARRLWHRVFGSHRLSLLEAELLGAPRGDDIPGWMIPQVFVRYLRTADRGALEPILRHNRRDLLALLGLHAHLTRVLEEPERRGPLDWEGAGVLLGRAGDYRRAAACFERALEDGGPRGPDLWRLLRRCARAYRALADDGRERRLWEWGGRAAPPDHRRRPEILTELSRARERSGDREGARNAAHAALRLLEQARTPGGARAERLRRRLVRLGESSLDRCGTPVPHL